MFYRAMLKKENARKNGALLDAETFARAIRNRA